MNNKKIKKSLLSVATVAFIALNAIFLFPKQADAFEFFGRVTCYSTWQTTNGDISIVDCLGCTRVEDVNNPADSGRCRPNPE